MEHIVVKTEMQNNGEILLYYVDENGESQQGIIATLDNAENSGIQVQDNYLISNIEDFVEDSTSLQEAKIEEVDESSSDPSSDWSEEDYKRLLTFYNDNKQSFSLSGPVQTRHLWTVACKTMLIGKDPDSCDMKLKELKLKYSEVRSYSESGVYVQWPFLELCHQAFHDELTNNTEILTPKIAILKHEIIKNIESRTVKQINTRNVDEKVMEMLNLYLKYKNRYQDHSKKDMWEMIAAEMGPNEDSNYWHKRFLNYKHHYTSIVAKQKETSTTVNWPYLQIFETIFQDDAEFNKKHLNSSTEVVKTEPTLGSENDWNTTYITVLGKYYLDSFSEFEDPTIPDMFLWTEVGRLIDKKPEHCRAKYAQLREEHIYAYISGNYRLESRKAIDIILDHIVAKDVKKVLNECGSKSEPWQTEQIDELVQFMTDNVAVFKDTVCYFVCWEAVAKKLKDDIESCKSQWDELVLLYSSILEDKKNDPEMQIDWRYIEMFDNIFDYGMDVNFIKGYCDTAESSKVQVKKITIHTENNEASKAIQDSELTSPRTDPRSTKILEYYLKNKDKFHTMKNKLSPWEPLAKEIDINTTQCAHRFKHLKKSYIETVQKEIDQPKVNITWPYYNLCKKVFGYRTVKSKLKQGTLSVDNNDWSAREIKQLIEFFARNFHEISNNVERVSIWAPLANELGKPHLSCRDKFVELRKCYRKLKTMRSRNPEVKISWNYFAMMDRIYSENEASELKVQTLEEEHLEMDGLEMAEGGEDDYECIIVLQEGQDLSDISNAQIVIQNTTDTEMVEETEQVPENLPEQPLKIIWTKRTKKLLLIHYINYMRSHRTKKINQKQLWEVVAGKLPNQTPAQCKKMFTKLKNMYKNADEAKQKSSPLHSLIEKVLKIKPKISISPIKDAKIHKTYKDVEMDTKKIESALSYYLSHIDDFVDPKFEKKFLWTELAQHINEPVTKVYNKINYLKQAYNVATEEVDGTKTEWSGILNEIIAKEVSINVLLDGIKKPSFAEDETIWTEDLIESLLTWYLGNLDKFKNPKFNRSYLWMEASTILNKSPLVCSKKMTEIRTQYRNMVKNNDSELNNWKFRELCLKIYGTGKKSSETDQ